MLFDKKGAYTGISLFGINLDKGIVWRNKIKLPFETDLRIDKNGFSWISYYNEIIQIDTFGKYIKKLRLKLVKNQRIANLLILRKTIF